MLRIEEIVGAMDDEFRYALDALSDERLAVLAADKAALRRLRPVGVSHAEALAMIAAIQAKRQETRARQERTERKKHRRAAVPRIARLRKGAVPEPVPAPVPEPAPPSLAAPPQTPRLSPPAAHGPAIRLPPPPADAPAIPLPPPEQDTAEIRPPRLAPNRLPTAVILAGLLAVAAVLAMM